MKTTQRRGPLYGALPYACIGSGLLAILVLQNMVAAVGGTVLVVVGAIGVARRWSGRELAAARSRMAARLAAEREGPETPALMQIAWRKSFECGHPQIDAQHRRLFEIGNAVVDAVRTGSSRNHIEDLLDELTRDIRTHFKTEEAVLARARYPLTEAHRAQHAALLKTAQTLSHAYRHGRLEVSELVGFIAYEVITEHIIKQDLKFALKPEPLPPPVAG